MNGKKYRTAAAIVLSVGVTAIAVFSSIAFTGGSSTTNVQTSGRLSDVTVNSATVTDRVLTVQLERSSGDPFGFFGHPELTIGTSTYPGKIAGNNPSGQAFARFTVGTRDWHGAIMGGQFTYVASATATAPLSTATMTDSLGDSYQIVNRSENSRANEYRISYRPDTGSEPAINSAALVNGNQVLTDSSVSGRYNGQRKLIEGDISFPMNGAQLWNGKGTVVQINSVRGVSSFEVYLR